METDMRAIVVTEDAPGRLAVGERSLRSPDSTEAVVRVQAVSLNRGEVRRAQSMPTGAGIGWDLAGIIETPAGDGSGPPVGTRVVGFSPRLGVRTRARTSMTSSVSMQSRSSANSR